METKNKIVIIRVDYNVPIIDGIIQDTYRIDSSIQSIKNLLEENAKVYILSHIESGDKTLKPVFEYIKKTYDLPIVFSDTFENIENLDYGHCMLIENIRNWPEETQNSLDFAKYIKDKTQANFFVFDAFAAAHRAHTSTSALASLFSMNEKSFGLLVQKELHALQNIVDLKEKTSVILSGSKFSTKIPLIEKYINKADVLFVAGALLNTVLYSMKYEVGLSIRDKDTTFTDNLILNPDFKNKVFIPQYVVTQNRKTVDINNIQADEYIYDIDNDSLIEFVKYIKDKNIQTIIWNGPLGLYEKEEYKKGTLFLMQELVKYSSENNVKIYIGGGDTASAIQELSIKNDNVFVSTGGGAMLEFLQNDGSLPALDAVRG